MTLIANLAGKEYRIRLEKDVDGKLFQAHITGPDGERVIPVQLVTHREGCWILEVEGRIEEVLITSRRGELVADWRHRHLPIQITSLQRRLVQGTASPETTSQVAEVRAQMPGTVIRVLANQDQQVEAGQGLLIVEAMKMQNQITTPRAGRVSHCGVEDGQAINTGDLLFQIE